MRRRFTKEGPDRAWDFIHTNLDVTVSFDAGNTWRGFDMRGILSYDDIQDNSVLAGQKSDWFIKRVLIDVYAAASMQTDNARPARLWQLALGTMADTDATILINDATPNDVLSSQTHNAWRRPFRGYTRPVYATAVIPYSTDTDITVTTTNPADQYGATDSPWGPALIRDDFEVSNAGLSHGDSMWLAAGQCSGPGGYDWLEGETLYLMMDIRTLWQRRRQQ